MFDLYPSAIDRPLRTPVGETLRVRQRYELVYPITEECIVSNKRDNPGTDR